MAEEQELYDLEDLTAREVFLINEALHFEEFDDDVVSTMGRDVYQDLIDLRERTDEMEIGTEAEE